MEASWRPSQEADGKGSAPQRWRAAGPAADVRLPVRVIQILPEARDCERILEPFKDPASAGLPRLQARGPAGACVRGNRLFIGRTRNGPFVPQAKCSESEGERPGAPMAGPGECRGRAPQSWEAVHSPSLAPVGQPPPLWGPEPGCAGSCEWSRGLFPEHGAQQERRHQRALARTPDLLTPDPRSPSRTLPE